MTEEEFKNTKEYKKTLCYHAGELAKARDEFASVLLQELKNDISKIDNLLNRIIKWIMK